VPALGVVDLPFVFPSRDAARAAMDGELGRVLAREIEKACDYRVLGWFENGFRHISNRLRPIRAVADMAGMRIRVLPSEVQARTFALLGAQPQKLDLTEALAAIPAGTLDAQENPLANTVTYGVHKHHRFHTLTNHFYISRPIFLHRPSYDAWPEELKTAMAAAVRDAVAFQRRLAEEEAETAAAAIRDAGGEILELGRAERDAFAAAVRPLLAEARAAYGGELLSLLPQS
jgi:TRAP-type C4-dicarboxylate transport system substrate-binding protein